MQRTISLVLFLILSLGSQDVDADFFWGIPSNLGPRVNSPSGEGGACLSADGLELIFQSSRPGGHGGEDLWVTTRPTKQDDWVEPVNLGAPANSPYSTWEPSLSSDGLSLYFSDGHSPPFDNPLPGGLGGQGDIWMIARETIHAAWSGPANIGPAVNSQHAVSPCIAADGLSLVFQSHRPGKLGDHCDIMVTTRESVSDAFGNPQFLRNVNSVDGEWMPELSADGRVLLICRNTATEIWMAMRPTVHDDFDPPRKLSSRINLSPHGNNSPTLSPDGSTLIFNSNRPGGAGGYDLWQVALEPFVDFDGSGTIDLADLVLIIENWGADDPLYDIGPMPWGDGTVDESDLEILMNRWGQEAYDPHLVAHWKFDETEGVLAQDSANEHHAILVGNALWQPDGGQIDGAIELDGVDDYVSAPSVLNPSVGTFSVYAWIQGGAPDQVVLSQSETANWLMLDAQGQLKTALKGSGGRAKDLESETSVTDGIWHRVGFSWDGQYRALYVDDIEVARDQESLLIGSGVSFLIGADQDLSTGSFWSGLMDDVRIYARPVVP